MAPNAIKAGSLSLMSNLKPEEFAKAPKLIEESAKVKQAKKGGFVYLKIGVSLENVLGSRNYTLTRKQWIKETSSKPAKPITAKEALGIIEAVIAEFENLPKKREDKRINLNAKESSVPGKTKREGWIAFQVKGELQEAKAAASCFTRGSLLSHSTSLCTDLSRLS